TADAANQDTIAGLAFDQALQPIDQSVGGVSISAPPSFLQTLMFPLSFGLGAPTGSIAQALADTIRVDSGNLTVDAGTASVQDDRLVLAPTADASALGATAALDGSSGIDGQGTNSATDSLGTAQLGGGNTAGSSLGTLQIGSLYAAPTLDFGLAPLGTSVALGGSSGVAGSGNQATGSIGTAQVGGGNSADGSAATAQSRSVDLGPSASLTAGGQTVGLGGGTNVGGAGNGAGNSATGSTGTAQV